MKICLLLTRKKDCAPNRVVHTLAAFAHNDNYLARVIYLFPNRDKAPISLIFYISYIRFLLQHLLSADIIHCNGFLPDLLGSVLYLIPFRRFVVVSTIHCDITRDLHDGTVWFFSPFLSFIWKACLSFRSGIVFLNSYHRSKLPVSSTTVVQTIPNALTFKLPLIDKAPYSQRSSQALLYIGALRPNKGVSLLLPLLKHLPNYHLYLYGEGSQSFKASLLDQAIKLGCYQRVHFMGYSPNPLKTMLSYRLALVPSLTEGFCLVVLEAIASGLNIVCSNIPEFRELYPSPPVNLVDFSNPALAAQKVLNAITDAPASSLRSYYLSTYSAESMWTSYRSFYQSLLASASIAADRN